jgi:hypothetical protein
MFMTEDKGASFKGVLYHGSGFSFDNFDAKKARIVDDLWGGGLAYLTTDQKVAITYAKSMAKTAKTGTPYVYQISASFSKIFDVDRTFTGSALTDILPKSRKDMSEFARGAGLLKMGADEATVLYKLETGKLSLTGDEIFRGLSKGMSKTAAVREMLISKGYDGLRYNGGVQMSQAIKHDVYIAYFAKSLKVEKRFKVVTNEKDKKAAA